MPELCGVPSCSLGPCDMPKGHAGDMHGSAGDGFYATCKTCKKPLQSGKVHPTWNEKKLGWDCTDCGGK